MSDTENRNMRSSSQKESIPTNIPPQSVPLLAFANHGYLPKGTSVPPIILSIEILVVLVLSP
jgi:hypothetical protein